MNETPNPGSQAREWIDRFAIGMAMLCAVHCLLMPILLIALPIIATGFFAHENFHLWMLWLVLPSTCISMYMGCRKHKDRWTLRLGAVGVLIVTAVALYEGYTGAAADVHSCSGCVVHDHGAKAGLPMCAWLNTLGGLFLVAAHTRNYRLCRKSACTH